MSMPLPRLHGCPPPHVPSGATMMWSPSLQCAFEKLVIPTQGCEIALTPPAPRMVAGGFAPAGGVPDASTAPQG